MVDEMPPARLRVLVDGLEMPIRADYSRCSPWIADKTDLDCSPYIDSSVVASLAARRYGAFSIDFNAYAAMPEPRPIVVLIGNIVRIEHLGDGESFEAVVTHQCAACLIFRSHGAPTKMSEPEEKQIKWREWI